MARGILLEITPSGGGNYTEVVERIANKQPVDLSGFNVVQHVSPLESFKEEFVDYICQYGLSSLLRRGLLNEAIVSPSSAKPFIENLLIRFLHGIQTEAELVIVDPYFFAPTLDTTYPSFVENILRPFATTLKSLTVVTLPGNKVSAPLRTTIFSRLTALAPALVPTHKTTHKFHDRFWLNPQKRKGFLSGTSANGLGRKYAVVDYLLSEDVDDVLAALAAEHLLSANQQPSGWLRRLFGWLR